MLPNFFGGSPSASTPAAAAPAAPNPAPQSEPLRADPPMSAQSEPTPAQNSTPSPQNGPVDLASLLLGTPEASTTPDPLAGAGEIMRNLTGGGATDNSGQPAVRINETALRSAMSELDLTEGVDWAAFETAMQQGGSMQDAFKGAMQTQGLNVMTTLAPVLNMFVQQAVQQATQQAVTQSQHSLTSSSIVSAMRDQYAYASNPVALPMIETLANQLAKTMPANTPVKQVTAKIDELFRSMSAGLTTNPADQHQRPGVQSEFSGLFNS